ncbi:Mariner Mos1 transposase [Eumeta japonica]|uniref:Mariner Mos1 transposase n=1 Tax=Eumeta variegata TaxID=151549 RepID=A0A4C1TI68_EUMVA|nr:Mariner Mos1 transposase [Eumeta japonica]
MDKNVRKDRVQKVQASSTSVELACCYSLIANPGLTGNKIMVCVWWDWKGIIYYELLLPGKTINSDLYYQQMMKLKQEVKKKRSDLINRNGVGL